MESPTLWTSIQTTGFHFGMRDRHGPKWRCLRIVSLWNRSRIQLRSNVRFPPIADVLKYAVLQPIEHATVSANRNGLFDRLNSCLFACGGRGPDAKRFCGSKLALRARTGRRPAPGHTRATPLSSQSTPKKRTHVWNFVNSSDDRRHPKTPNHTTEISGASSAFMPTTL
jgi:hypothetical protein